MKGGLLFVLGNFNLQSKFIWVVFLMYGLLANIPTHLHTTLQMLNNLKEKQIKTKTTIENLTTHKTDGTLPNNLTKTTDCHIILQGPNYRQKTASLLFKKIYCVKIVDSGRPSFPIR